MKENMWELRQGNILLGTLTMKSQDMNLMLCDFVATPAFEQYRALFAEEYRLLDTEGVREGGAWEATYARITALKLSLHDRDNFDDENIILLHVVNDEAWFGAVKGPTSGWIAD